MSALPTTPVDTPRPGHAIRRILLATDLAAASSAATEQAFGLAKDLGASLLVVSVIEPDGATGTGQRVVRMDQRRMARELEAQSLVIEGQRRGVRVSFLVWQGEPGPAILEAAESESVDLIVMGTRGRNRVERFILGSVSDHVVRHANCPVLIVRP